jgi:hypothetical protein
MVLSCVCVKCGDSGEGIELTCSVDCVDCVV